MSRYRPARLLLLVAGCLVLGLGVGLLLTADLGSDGYSTLVNGISRATDTSFGICNLGVAVVFLALAATRRVTPDVGTVVQILVVGWTVAGLLALWDTPSDLAVRVLLLVVALVVLAVGVAAYLGSNLGAGPAEAAALAWDPPVPFKWSYSILQGGGALAGWLLGASVGPGTLAVIVGLGPMVDLAAHLLRLDVHQERHEPATLDG
ncbi:MAG: hypothetical protein J7518_15635 [Nocardioidaceae bacterium]|nr:hypothetical protein [Nocardioidaceae bacterium]